MATVTTGAHTQWHPGEKLPAASSSSGFDGTVAESLAIVVSPTTGRFRPQWESGRAARGAVIGMVTGGRGRADVVRMPVDGEVRSLLVRPGQLVRAGQSLAWIDRSARV